MIQEKFPAGNYLTYPCGFKIPQYRLAALDEKVFDWAGLYVSLFSCTFAAHFLS
jgi:hypothetical protein